MFDQLKKDIRIGDKVKIQLITGKEPEGIVLEISETFILLQTEDGTQNRLFDKLIGGWVVVQKAILNDTLDETERQKNTEKISVRRINLIEKANQFKNSLDKIEVSKSIEPNATIIETRGTTCIASNNKESNILIPNNRIADAKLISELEAFHKGSIIPVVLSMYDRNGKLIINAVALPNSLGNYIDNFIYQLEQGNITQARLIFYIIRNNVQYNKHLHDLIVEIKSTHAEAKNPKNIQVLEKDFTVERKAFKSVEKEINNLIRESKFEFALSQIDKELSHNSLDNKYKSSLLLKKAQIFSSLNNPDASEEAYQELVNFNEKIKAPANNLSHLYTELARLQLLKIEKQLSGLQSIKRALSYNRNNNFALNLLKQFEGKSLKNDPLLDEQESADDHLLIQVEEDTNEISKMIDLDIKEHKYTHPEILKSGSKPTPYIAKLILEEAKENREGELAERYPLYLEAAKAFSELNVGSYDFQDFLEAVAFYSMLKGNSIFIDFKNRIFNNDIEVEKLRRLKDSACSYYLESLNLLSNIDPNLLLTILSNYLKVNMANYYVESKNMLDFRLIFKGQFADVFTACLRNKNKDIERIAYQTILSVGASSILAWNELSKLDKGTSRLYLEFKYDHNKKRIYTLLNSLNQSSVSHELNPKDFLKSIFVDKRKTQESLQFQISKIFNVEIEPHSIGTLSIEWDKFGQFEFLFTDTDREIKNEIDDLFQILKPYLNRGQSERTNILIKSRSIIERQLRFINDNTTYYGRTFFYGLLTKWRREIDSLLDEKISQSFPSLELSIDPPYFIKTNDEISAPLIIKNIGEATSEGFTLNIKYESTEYEDSVEWLFDSEVEIPSNGKIETSIAVPPQLLKDSKAIELRIEAVAIYQNKDLNPKIFEFTIEEEPESVLTHDDIPWRDGKIPQENLFKGRRKLIADLAQHYLSIEKDKPYILYGLTRTGKSSILEYLRKDIEGDTFISQGRELTVITFSWDLSQAASFKKAADFWEYILYEQTFEVFRKYSQNHGLSISDLKIDENVRAKDFKILLEYIGSKNLYPIFFVDEFSFIKTLIDDLTVNTAFLHTLRQFSLNDMASFIFAGTYDIKDLIKNPKYGITGQLVNAIEEQVNEISDTAAEELIQVINSKLSFTPEAIDHIKFLSGNVPYFIQIICKSCGYYAAENKRRHIGYPELEKVLRILIGKEPSSDKSLVKKLPETIFQNNQYSPSDPKEVSVLISSLTHFNKDRIDDPRGVSFAELQKLWADKGIIGFRQKLADAIQLLKEKKIIIQNEDEGIPVYKLSVDLFRRWWSHQNPDINLTLTTLTE